MSIFLFILGIVFGSFFTLNREKVEQTKVSFKKILPKEKASFSRPKSPHDKAREELEELSRKTGKPLHEFLN